MLTQAVADAAVLSAGDVQAIGMNEIADLNAEIKKLRTERKQDFRETKHFVIGSGWATWGYYQTQIDYLRGLQDKANHAFATMAHEAAEKIVDMHNENYKKLYSASTSTTRRSFKAAEKWKVEEVMGGTYPQKQLLKKEGNLKIFLYIS